MKKLILAATLLAIAGMNIQPANAEDRGWATVGKVLTGVAIGAAVASALDCQPAYASVSYTYTAPACTMPRPAVCPPPVVVAPAPVVIYHSPVCYVPPRPLVSVNVGYTHGYTHYRGYSYGHHRR